MRRLRVLAIESRVRDKRDTGPATAFNAGAVNANGFLVLHRYPSHITELASLEGLRSAASHNEPFHRH